MAINKPIFTSIGLAKITAAMANSTNIILDTIALGDASSDLTYLVTPDMTGLKDEVTRIKVRTITTDDKTYYEELILRIFGIMLPAEAIDMTIRELGIYDTEGDLILVSRCSNISTKIPESLRTGVEIKFGKRVPIAAKEVFKINPIGNDDPIVYGELLAHTTQESDPHKTTKAQVELGNVENVADIDMPMSNIVKDLLVDSQLAHGFVNRESSNLVLTDSTTVTLDMITTTDIYKEGVLYTLENDLTFDAVDNGEYYIGINPIDGVLYKIIELNIEKDIPVAYIIKNSVNGIIDLSDERHLCSKNNQWYKMQDNHNSISWLNGGDLSIALNSDTNVAINIESPILMSNKELMYSIMHETTIDSNYEQNLVDAVLPVLWIGPSNQIMMSKNDTGMSWLFNGFRAVFNNTETGTLGTVTNGSFINYILLYTSDIKTPVKLVVGNKVYANKADAVAADIDDYGYILNRIKAKKAFRIVLETNDLYTGNLANAKIVDIIDLTNDTGLRQTFSPNSHDDLGDSRFEPDQHDIDNIEGLADTIDGVGLIKAGKVKGNITGEGVIVGDTLVINNYQADTRTWGGSDDNLFFTDLIGSDYGTTDTKWASATLALNGKIYFTPTNATGVLELDPVTKTTSIIGSTYGTSTFKWYSSALAPNGKIYCAPYTQSQVLEIDPVAKTTNLVGAIYSGAGGKWLGIVLAPNGKLYLIPHESETRVLEFDPIAKTTTYIGASYLDHEKWWGGCLAPNGKIYCAPFKINYMLEINPGDKTTRVISTLSISNISSHGAIGIVLSPNGKLYYFLRSDTLLTSFIVEFNPNTEIFSKIITKEPLVFRDYHSPVLSSNGRIIFTSSNKDRFLEFDHISNEAKEIGHTSSNASVIHSAIDSVLAPNGKIYRAHTSLGRIIEIDTFPKATDFGSYLLTAQFKI